MGKRQLIKKTSINKKNRPPIKKRQLIKTSINKKTCCENVN